MGKRITDEQVARARQLFRDGYSIPECCRMAEMSRASFNKYLGKDVQTWLDEHNKAREDREQQQRISEIVPSTIPVNLGEIIAEAADLSEAQLTYSQFESYAEFELASCSDDVVEIEQVYRQLKEDYKQEYRFVIRLRELYEVRLGQIGNTNTDRLINKDIKVSNKSTSVDVVDGQVPSFTEGLICKSAEQTQQTIKSFKSRFGVHIPVPRLTTLVDWDERRLNEHLIFWLYKNYKNLPRKQCHEAATKSTLSEGRALVEELVSEL